MVLTGSNRLPGGQWLVVVVVVQLVVLGVTRPSTVGGARLPTSGSSRSGGRVLPGDVAQASYGSAADRPASIGLVEGRLDELEQRFVRRLEEQSRKLNQSVAIQYLEKVLDYVSEEMQTNRELLTTTHEDRLREIEQLRTEVERQRAELRLGQSTIAELRTVVANLSALLREHLVASATGDHGDHGPPGALTSVAPTAARIPIDCQEALIDGSLLQVDGFQYTTIQPRTSPEPFRTCCNVRNLTGWTVIQRRLDGSVDFYRNWSDYKIGFGQLDGEFWLGNEHIHHLTNQGDYRLRVDMVTWDDQPHWAEYRHFRLSPEGDKYRLNVAGFVPGGNAGDSMTSAWDNDHNGQQFSTYDSDNDARFYDNCAQHYHGAWWFRSCFQSHLNGVYYPRGAHSNFFVRNGVQWNTIHPHSSLRHVVMMVRRNGGDVTAAGDDITSNGLE